MLPSQSAFSEISSLITSLYIDIIRQTTSYQSSTALSCAIFEMFDVKEYRNLKIDVMGDSQCKFSHDNFHR